MFFGLKFYVNLWCVSHFCGVNLVRNRCGFYLGDSSLSLSLSFAALMGTAWFLAMKYSLVYALICAKTSCGKCESILLSVMILSPQYLSKTAFLAFLRYLPNGMRLHKNCKIVRLVRKNAYSNIACPFL